MPRLTSIITSMSLSGFTINDQPYERTSGSRIGLRPLPSSRIGLRSLDTGHKGLMPGVTIHVKSESHGAAAYRRTEYVCVNKHDMKEESGASTATHADRAHSSIVQSRQ